METKFKIYKVPKNEDLIIGNKTISGFSGYPLYRADGSSIHIILFWMGNDHESNVMGYDIHGNLLWIAEPAWIGLGENRKINPYSSLSWDERRQRFTLGTYSGTNYILNLKSGAVQFSDYHK